MMHWSNSSNQTLGLGKAGGYDLAGMMGKYAQLIEGTEPTVLGFTQSSLDLLDDVQSMFSMSRS